jgi:hypothetical protein
MPSASSCRKTASSASPTFWLELTITGRASNDFAPNHVAFMLQGAAAAFWKSLEMNGIMLHMLHVWRREMDKTKAS